MQLPAACPKELCTTSCMVFTVVHVGHQISVDIHSCSIAMLSGLHLRWSHVFTLQVQHYAQCMIEGMLFSPYPNPNPNLTLKEGTCCQSKDFTNPTGWFASTAGAVSNGDAPIEFHDYMTFYHNGSGDEAGDCSGTDIELS